MKVKGQPPAWAMEIIRNEARRRGRAMPDVLWRRRRKDHREESSSGSASPPGLDKDYPNGALSIMAGNDRVDQKYVLCHEIAHWLRCPDDIHTPEYWDLAWRIFRRWNLPINYVRERAGAYRAEAETAYQRSRRRLRR